MRVSTAKRALQEGNTVICIQPHFPSPEFVEFLGYLGFDCIFIDAEHGVVGVERAQEMVRAADAAGIATLIRVPKNDPAMILGYLFAIVNAASLLVSSARQLLDQARKEVVTRT